MTDTLLKKALAKYVLHRVRQNMQHERFPEHYNNLYNPIPEWKHKDYENLAGILNASTPTIKRLFNRPGYTNHQQFNNANKQLFIVFLGLNTWEEVEKEALMFALKRGLMSE